MVDIIDYMDSLMCLPPKDIKAKVKKIFGLEDWEMEILYDVWKTEFMKPKYNQLKRESKESGGFYG